MNTDEWCCLSLWAMTQYPVLCSISGHIIHKKDSLHNFTSTILQILLPTSLCFSHKFLFSRTFLTEFLLESFHWMLRKNILLLFAALIFHSSLQCFTQIHGTKHTPTSQVDCREFFMFHLNCAQFTPPSTTAKKKIWKKCKITGFVPLLLSTLWLAFIRDLPKQSLHRSLHKLMYPHKFSYLVRLTCF